MKNVFRISKKCCLVVMLSFSSSLVSISAFAENNFAGIYGQAGVGYGHDELSYTQVGSTANGGATLNPTGSNPRRTNFNAEFGLGYYKPLFNNLMMGLGASYSPQSQNLNTYTVSSPGQASLNGGYKIQNRYSIFLSPAMSIGNDGMAYLKLGYSGQTIGGYTGFLSAMPNQNQSGYIVGGGYKYLISNNVFLFGEANYYSYSKINSTFSYGGNLITVTPQLEAYNGVLGIGYRY